MLKFCGGCARAQLANGISLVTLMFLAAGAASAAPLHRYIVAVGESLDLLAVKACFDGKVPGALVAETSGARTFLEEVRLSGRLLQPQGGEVIALDGAPDNACVDYRVKLRAATSAAQTGGPETRRIGRDLLTSVGDWLWRPRELEEGADVELSFVLPAGVAVSAPWARAAADAAKPTFRLGPTSYNWPAIAAFGRFAEREIVVPGALLRLVFLGGLTPAQQARAEQWVRGAAHNVTTPYGRFPVESVQVIVAPTPRGRGPVPWAYVSRGGGAGVHLFIDPDRAPEEFDRDWSLTHEMSHLFLPYVAVRDAWLFESNDFPDFKRVLVRAGVTVKDGEVVLDSAAPGAPFREALMRPLAPLPR